MSDPSPSPWPRFRRAMRVSALAAALAVAGALGWLWASGAPMRVGLLLAVTLGIGASVLLGGALMGLVYVSARSGHDDTVLPPIDEERR